MGFKGVNFWIQQVQHWGKCDGEARQRALELGGDFS